MEKKSIQGVGIEEMKKIVNERLEADEVILREIKPFGLSGAHISGINPDHIGKEARIIIKPKKQEEHKE